MRSGRRHSDAHGATAFSALGEGEVPGAKCQRKECEEFEVRRHVEIRSKVPNLTRKEATSLLSIVDCLMHFYRPFGRAVL